MMEDEIRPTYRKEGRKENHRWFWWWGESTLKEREYIKEDRVL